MAQRIKRLKTSRSLQKKSKNVSGKRGRSFQSNTLKQALTLYHAGHLSQAEALYRQILFTEPDQPDALHYLGVIAFQTGRGETAIELINKALFYRPDCIEALINLGIVFKALGKLDEAFASFRRVLDLKPDLAEAHFNLGNILSAQGKLDEAVTSYRQALSLKPDFPEALINLGTALNDRGKPDEALASYLRALSLKPDLAELHNSIGTLLKSQGKLDEAITSYRKSLELKPVAEVYYSLGHILHELGRMDEAITCFRQALSLKPIYPEAYKALSLILTFTEVDGEVTAMQEMYNKREDISDTGRIHLGFALGKAFEDLKEYDKAFDYLLSANLIKRKSYKYSIQEDYDFFERIKNTFSSDFFTAHPGLGNQDRTPIFILGMPRSGTTLVEQILASHPLVFGAGESAILTTLIDNICPGGTTAQFPECMLDFYEQGFEKIGMDYIEKISRFSKHAKYITDKTLDNFLRIGFIKTIFPKAKVIHCARNPMDTCFSIFKKDFIGTHKYAYDMVELGQYYNLYRGLMVHWEKALPGFIYTVEYEKLVSYQKDQTKSLLDFCGLPWDEACLAFHKTERRVSTASLAQVRQPIYQDSVELWKRYAKQLEPLRKAIYG